MEEPKELKSCHALRATIHFPKKNRPNIKCDGSSIWGPSDGTYAKVDSVMFHVQWWNNNPSVDVYINHTSNAWWIYTDRGAEKSVSKIISKLIGFPVTICWAEQEMQQERRASMLVYSKKNEKRVYQWLVSHAKLRKFNYTKFRS